MLAVSPAAEALAGALEYNETISELNLHKTGLGDRNAGRILEALKKHPAISVLDLGDNNLGAKVSWWKPGGSLFIDALVNLLEQSKVIMLPRHCLLPHFTAFLRLSSW